MQKALIVSPDPQTARMLTLALELEGWETKQSAEISAPMTRGVDAIILDLIEGEHEIKAAAKGMDAAVKAGAKAVVILPRGYDREKAAKQLSRAALIIARPFHLTSLVEHLLELTE